MSDTTPVVTPTAAAVSTEATIHDAIDSLFTAKESAPVKPAPIAPVETAPAEKEPAADEVVTPVTPPEAKTSAADLAIEVARLKKKRAELAAKAPKEEPIDQKAVDLAKRLQAAGKNPLAAFKETGIDFAELVQAFDNDMNDNPAQYDPLQRDLVEIKKELALYKQELKAKEDAAATDNFLKAAAERVKSSDKYDFVAAFGDEGLSLVKDLVLTAANGDEAAGIAPHVLSLAEALEMAEAHYASFAERAAKAKKFSAFTPPTKKPSISQQAPLGGTAPSAQTKQKSTQDVINEIIDAQFGQ